MPSVKLSPLFNDAQLDNNGLPLSGGQVYWYIAGTTTPVTVYTESSGSTVNTNPVVLNTRGEPVQPIWLPTGQAYKAVLTDSTGALIRTIDNVYGINDTSAPVISEWVLYSATATFVSTTSFSVAGDQRSYFTNGRRIKATVSGTDVYGTINATPTYGAGVTTVHVTIDGGAVFDASLTTVYYGFLDPTHPSFDTTGVNNNTISGIQSQSWIAFPTGGATGVYTLTPLPAITIYATGQRFNVTFNAASSATNTLNVSGLGAKSIKMYNSAGTKIDAVFALNQIADVIYDGTDFVMNPPQALLAGGTFTGAITGTTINGTTMQQGGIAMPRMVQGTVQYSFSGTAKDFTGIPSWAKRITVILSGVSTNATSDIIIRIGPTTVPETTGYVGSSIQVSGGANIGGSNATDNGFCIAPSVSNATVFHGVATINLITGSTWVCSSSLARSDANATITGAGTKTITGYLGVVSITTVNGLDAFDGGLINILYEG